MFSPAELLSTFKKSFLHDQPMLKFNYFGFWVSCRRLLHDIFDALVSASIPTGVLKEIRDCPSMMAYGILLDAAKHQDHPEEMADSMHAYAAKVMGKYIKDQGKTFVKPAYDQSSGRIPKNLCPTSAECYVEQQKRASERASVLKSAGSSVEFSGDLVALYHPFLTMDNLNAARNSRSNAGDIVLRSFMIDSNDNHGDGDAEAGAKAWFNAIFDSCGVVDEVDAGRSNPCMDEQAMAGPPQEAAPERKKTLELPVQDL